jgi:hypothetical protein
MTADDKVLLRRCGCILLHDPNQDDIAAVYDALQLLAGAALCDSIEAEYQSLVSDAKLRGAL